MDGLVLDGDRFKSCVVGIIANGASLTQEQVDSFRNYRVIAINDTYKLAPWADILYACDSQWWGWHNGCPDFKGWKITHQQDSVKLQTYPGIDYILSNGKSGFDNKQDRIKHGGNSGFQALQLAIKMGARDIRLIGYDMHANSGVSHWFGEHPIGKQRDSRYNEWINEFNAIAPIIEALGVNVVNCTPDSALKCFKTNNEYL